MKTYETIVEMTGQESGAIIFDGIGVIVCNWAYVANEGGIPRVFCGDLIVMDSGEKLTVEKVEEFSGNIDDLLYNGATLHYDVNDDIDSLLDGSLHGKVYHLDNGIVVVAPEGWN